MEKWESLVRAARFGQSQGNVNVIAYIDAILEGAGEIERLNRKGLPSIENLVAAPPGSLTVNTKEST